MGKSNIIHISSRRRITKLSPERWQLLIKACQELYFNSELAVRSHTQVRTERQILGLLSKHFGLNEVSKVLGMILTSYELYYSTIFTTPESRIESESMQREIAYLLALAHTQRTIAHVESDYQKLLTRMPVSE